MPNVKISAAADAGTLLSSDMLPLARAGDTNAYHATMAEVATYTSASIASGTYGNTGRNLVHNPLMTINQRSSGPYTASGGYTLDRWLLLRTTDTASISQQPLSDADRAAIGDEAAIWCMQNVFAGNAGAGSFNLIAQPIEGVRRLGNKTITVSMWAVASSGTPLLGVQPLQSYGTGGAPSTPPSPPPQTNQRLSTTWTRYNWTFTLPSTAGATLGTNGNDYTNLQIVFSSANMSMVQSNTVRLWGVQLEIGSVATPLAKRDPADDLALCQRFYQTNIALTVTATATAGGQTFGVGVMLPVVLRGASPTVNIYQNTGTNNGTPSASASAAWVTGWAASNTSGTVAINLLANVSADL